MESDPVFDAFGSPQEIASTIGELLRRLTPDGSARLPLLLERDSPALDAPKWPVLKALCRLVLKCGDLPPLREAVGLRPSDRSIPEYVFRLSFLLRQRERELAGEPMGSSLFKGLAQIAMGQVELGTKNVLAFLDRHGSAPAASQEEWLDDAQAQWGLCSAALRQRDLSLAMEFAVRWHASALRAALGAEAGRSLLATALFHLLLGRAEESLKPMEEFRQLAGPRPPAARLIECWALAETAGLERASEKLTDWPETHRATPEYLCALEIVGRERTSAAAPSPPLLLGLDWCDPSGEPKDEFARLCRMRRRMAGREPSPPWQAEELLTSAGLATRWDLGGPLRKLEARLAEVQPGAHLKFLLGRLTGRQVAEFVTSRGGEGCQPRINPDTIIWMSDVRGYSALSEHMDPREAFAILSPVFKIITEEMESAGGTVLEFVGDSIMVVLNAFSQTRVGSDEVFRRTARCVQRISQFIALACKARFPDIRLGIGINRGPVAVAYLGGLDRCHLATLGHTVNLASRVEGLTRTIPASWLATAAVFEQARPEVWAAPDEVNYAVRDWGARQVKNIAEPVRVFGLHPLLRYWVDFVPMGFVAASEPGVVYLDTGYCDSPGVFDHHFPGTPGVCACDLVVRGADRLRGHLRAAPGRQIEFRVHESPDLDCAASLYAAYEALEGSPRMELLTRLAEYVGVLDSGASPLPQQAGDSLYGTYYAHLHRTRERLGVDLTDAHLLEAGLRVIDAALYLAQAAPQTPDFHRIFAGEPGWFPQERALLERDRRTYEEDLRRKRVYQARVGGRTEPVWGIRLDHPESLLFKAWARSDPNAPGGNGYGFLVVDWSSPQAARFVISVDPASGTHLKGLGLAVEAAETAKREKLNRPRPVEPKRYPADNADPWYFGQGHHYTIIDSPACGTVLSEDELREIHCRWIPQED